MLFFFFLLLLVSADPRSGGGVSEDTFSLHRPPLSGQPPPLPPAPVYSQPFWAALRVNRYGSPQAGEKIGGWGGVGWGGGKGGARVCRQRWALWGRQNGEWERREGGWMFATGVGSPTGECLNFQAALHGPFIRALLNGDPLYTPHTPCKT